jgi:hypothetical protein
MSIGLSARLATEKEEEHKAKGGTTCQDSLSSSGLKWCERPCPADQARRRREAWQRIAPDSPKVYHEDGQT